ncbi:MAG: imidazole glycerol phosphate synthase subunit HisH [Bifidobacteriaceae bacterium]|jgi:glutamine amidotransferase|nr:imidazole glycerol phosphate synthase subunit HisH [Bifidobacteriaceae bacterium]
MRVVVLDYGFGNTRSAVRAAERAGARVELTAEPKAVAAADGLIVPGVGAFRAVMDGLRRVDAPRLIERRLAGGRAVLGICVGLQVMFERGCEGEGRDGGRFGRGGGGVIGGGDGGDGGAGGAGGGVADGGLNGGSAARSDVGLGQWPGAVTRLKAPVVPHIGWSKVRPPAGSRLFAGVADERFYFVHSYAAQEFPLLDAPAGPFAPPLVTWADYGGPFVAAVENGPLSATQFHPEKSGDAGARLLENWIGTL